MATDQEAGLIRDVAVTMANAHDASELAAILPDAPGETYGDSAYQGDRPEGVIRAQGAAPCAHRWVWQWSLTALRDRLVKIGAKIVRPGRSIAFQMAEVMVPRTLFRQILNANAVASVATSPMLRDGDTTGRVDRQKDKSNLMSPAVYKYNL